MLSERYPSETETVILTSPKKLGSGVMINWFPSITNDVLPSIALNSKLSWSISVAAKSIVNDSSSLISWFSILAIIGASLTGLTTKVKLFESDNSPSVTL